MCGACAGMTSVTFTYPLDIVRTRLSIQSASFAGLGSRDAQKKLPGMWSLMATMYKTEGGAAALYRGIIPTVAGVAPYVSYNIPFLMLRKCQDCQDTPANVATQVGLNFMCYESLRGYFTAEGESQPSAWGKLGAGALAGAIAQTCTYPL
jgi:solute carrier family 25 (mitochondrial phosphate transporter), member 23/24/25/41